MPAKRSPVRPDARRADLARIHVLRKELGWDEDLYRDVLATVCGGIRSSAELDITGRQRLIAHMDACKARAKGKAPRPATAARKPLSQTSRKLWSLWMQAADAGLVQARKMAALNAWVERQTGVSHCEFLNGDQAALAIESLKRWIRRGEMESPVRPAAQG
jgi:hypothetical protein